MKRLNAMTASFLLGTLAAAPVVAGESHEIETYQTQSYDFIFPEFIIEQYIERIDDAGWRCECRLPKPAIEKNFKTYNYKDGDSQSIVVKNNLNQPLKVVISLQEPNQSLKHSEIEMLIPAERRQEFSTTMLFPDKDTVHFVRTSVKIEIPENAEPADPSNIGAPLVLLTRTDKHPAAGIKRATGIIECQSKSSCELLGDSDTGQDDGPFY